MGFAKLSVRRILPKFGRISGGVDFVARAWTIAVGEAGNQSIVGDGEGVSEGGMGVGMLNSRATHPAARYARTRVRPVQVLKSLGTLLGRRNPCRSEAL